MDKRLEETRTVNTDRRSYRIDPKELEEVEIPVTGKKKWRKSK